ncbi:peptidase S8 [Candidatus Bathyarchaeota archaeon]|nr:peptidase S8 [Candidatus Bathyarchaeota archaeon]
MLRCPIRLSLLVLIILFMSVEVPSGGRDVAADAVEGEYLIGLRGADVSVLDLLERSGLKLVRRMDEIGVLLVRVKAEVMISEVVKALERSPSIEYIEPNYIVKLQEGCLGPSLTTSIYASIIPEGSAQQPNDPLYASDPQTGRGQWNLRVIGMQEAWKLEGGSREVRVAVVDTGVYYRHRDLQSSYMAGGYDWVNDDMDPDDDYGHGSWVAGIIAAETGNGYGVAGMARISIIAEKVLNNRGSGTIADLASGITHAADLGVDIINLSLGTDTYSSTLRRAVEYAYEKGCLLVAAAGNRGTSTPHYPAAFEEVIAVASTYGEPEDLRAPYSNYGEWITISAPGGWDQDRDGIPEAGEFWIISTDNKPDSFRLGTGTSASTPHVSGLAALIKSHHPQATSLEIRRILEYTALDKGTPGRDDYYGYGRIDAYKALKQPLLTSVGGEGRVIKTCEAQLKPGILILTAAITTITALIGIPLIRRRI